MKLILFLFFFIQLSAVVFHTKAQVIDSTDLVYPSILENKIFMDLEKMTLEDALAQYPNYFRKEMFDMKGGLNYGNRILLNVFPQYNFQRKKDQKKVPSLLIQEVSWPLDSKINLTVWYKKDTFEWKPVFNRIWYKGTLF